MSSHSSFVVAVFVLIATFLFVQNYILGEGFLNAVAQINNNSSCSRKLTPVPWFYYDYNLLPTEAVIQEPPSYTLLTEVNVDGGKGTTVTAPPTTHVEHFALRQIPPFIV